MQEQSGKAATKGYWKCHGKGHGEHGNVFATNSTKIGEIRGQVFSVFSVQNSVAENLCPCEKDPGRGKSSFRICFLSPECSSKLSADPKRKKSLEL